MSTAIGATSKMEFSMNSEQMDVQADKVTKNIVKNYLMSYGFFVHRTKGKGKRLLLELL